MLHNLQSSQNVSLSICQSLALLDGDQASYVSHVLFDQLLILEHDALPVERGSLAPRLEGFFGRGHSGVHLVLSRAWHLGDDFIGCRIVNIDPVGGGGVGELAIDEVLSLSRDFVADKAQVSCLKWQGFGLRKV